VGGNEQGSGDLRLALAADGPAGRLSRTINEKTIRGSCGDYRAAAGIDCELDTADLGRKLDMPILVLWGATSSVGKRFADPLGLWRLRANDVRGEALPTGHYVNEEAPDQVLAWFLHFFEA
jgi:haloacetate dehalogenase